MTAVAPRVPRGCIAGQRSCRLGNRSILELPIASVSHGQRTSLKWLGDTGEEVDSIFAIFSSQPYVTTSTKRGLMSLGLWHKRNDK